MSDNKRLNNYPHKQKILNNFALNIVRTSVYNVAKSSSMERVIHYGIYVLSRGHKKVGRIRTAGAKALRRKQDTWHLKNWLYVADTKGR